MSDAALEITTTRRYWVRYFGASMLHQAVVVAVRTAITRGGLTGRSWTAFIGALPGRALLQVHRDNAEDITKEEESVVRYGEVVEPLTAFTLFPMLDESEYSRQGYEE